MEKGQADRIGEIIKRLEKTQRNEGICLQWWEVDLLLSYLRMLDGRMHDGK